MIAKNRIQAPLKWHGGKWYLAPKIVALMPKHVHYVEPFAGGLSVLLAKDPTGISEVVNDLNGDLSNFWNVLRCPTETEKLQRYLEATPFSEDLFRRVIESPEGGTAVDRAWRFFVRCRQSLAGRMNGFATLSKNRVRRGMNEQASAWLGAIEGLAEVHARLKRVVILNRDALAVIRSEDTLNTLFYLDPPYLHETRTSTAVYQHEMSYQDHANLLDAILDCKGKVMLSGYRSDLYELKLKGWKEHVFELPNQASGGREKRLMEEIVWCNF